MTLTQLYSTKPKEAAIYAALSEIKFLSTVTIPLPIHSPLRQTTFPLSCFKSLRVWLRRLWLLRNGSIGSGLMIPSRRWLP